MLMWELNVLSHGQVSQSSKKGHLFSNQQQVIMSDDHEKKQFEALVAELRTELAEYRQEAAKTISSMA